jgi:hypothetical protein
MFLVARLVRCGLCVAFAIVGSGVAFVTSAHAASWSTPVAPPAGCGSSLAVNQSGAMVLAGFSQTGTGLEAFSVEVCSSSDGVHWSGPTTIGAGVAPAVALAPDGHAVAIWQGGPATMPDVQASVRSPSGIWSPPVLVSAVPGHPLIRMDGSGNAIAVWAGTTLATPVATASLRAGSSWTTTQVLTPQGSGIGLATSATGGAIVGWRTHAGQIQAAFGSVLGNLGAPVTVGGTYGALHATQVALDDAGAASLAWQTPAANFVVTRSSDGAWTTPTKLSANPAGVATAIDDAGDAIAAFSVLQATGTPTYVARRPAGGSWGTPVLVSALTDLGGARASGDAAGTFVVTWMTSGGTVEALTIPPGGAIGPGGTIVGAGPSMAVQVIPGEAVVWIGAGIAVEAVR